MKRARIRKVSANAKTWRALDKLSRRLVVELRDQNICQRCGKTSEQNQMHWAHVLNRGAKSAQWMSWNSLALCAGCHLYFDGDNRKSAREEWWAQKWPERANKLALWRSSRPKKIDLDLERQWLEGEIRAAEIAIAGYGPRSGESTPSVSPCCKSPCEVRGSRGGSSWYACAKCGEACDPVEAVTWVEVK